MRHTHPSIWIPVLALLALDTPIVAEDAPFADEVHRNVEWGERLFSASAERSFPPLMLYA